MTDWLQALIAEPVYEAVSRGSAAVAVPADQVAALVQRFRDLIASGAGDGTAVGIPDAMFVTARQPVLNADGTPLLDEAGQPVMYISATQPWATTGNPSEGYAKAVRAVLCGAKGGDGTAIWIGQSAVPVEHGPVKADGKRSKVNVRAGLVLKTTIPKAAKGIAPEYVRYQAA